MSSYSIVSVFLSLELQSFCFYILAAFKKDSIYSTEAGLKYFLLGGFSSAIVLFGSSLLYGFTGTTNFQELYIVVSSAYYGSSIIHLSGFFILTGFLFKLGAFPFHAWMPDVYEGSPTSSSIFFAVASKAALFLVCSRFLQLNINDTVFFWQYLVIGCGFLSILFGSFLGIKQRKLKRLLAYSSISHVGYLLLALATVSFEGFHALFFYLFFYMISAILVWSIVINMQCSLSSSRSITLSDLCALLLNNGVLSLSFLIAIFSMAGVPPLVGFYAKLSIFLSVINSNYFVFVVLAFLITVISAFFYLRLLKTVFFEKIINVNLFGSLSYSQANVISLSSISLVFFFFNPSLLDILCYRAALY